MMLSPNVCGLVLLLTVSRGQVQPASAWETFRPPAGKCQVQAPGVMRSQTGLPELAKLNKPVTLFVLQKQYHYLLGYIDYPPTPHKPLPPEKRLDQARDQALKLSRGKLLGEKKFAYGANLGRELKVEIAGKAFVRLRFVLVQDRLYFVGVLGSRGVLEARAAVKYLDSFELVK